MLGSYTELKELFGMDNPTRPLHMFKNDVAAVLDISWGAASWQLISKMESVIEGAWLNCRSAEYAADLANEIYMSKKQNFVQENPTKLAKKWGNYHEV